MTYLMNSHRFLLIIALLICAPQWAIAAQINVSVDRNPVNIDESFQIIFTAAEAPDDDPDFAPLEEDFEVLNQSHNSSSSWINGKASKSIQWVINVMARQPGNLTIPAIKFGHDLSQTGSVKVLQAAANKNIDINEDLYIEVEATPGNPYVQSQVIYTMRLYVKVNLAQASLNEPEIADAVVEKLGEDSKYSTQVNGMEYSVVERRYAIFPQKSGALTIKPLTLTAEVITNSRPSFNGFFNSQVTQTKHIKSKPITLDVKPALANFDGPHWLAADELVLKQEWSGDNQQIKVGEPLTRTLSLLAKGTTVGQLPELNTTKNDEHLKSYPDQPVLQEKKNTDGVVAFREEKIALILSKSGTYKLPAIKVPWFNTQSQKMEVAIIPETTITAIGEPVSQPQGNVPSAQPKVNPQKQEQQKVIPTIETQTGNNAWFWVCMALAIGWLLTVIYFLRRNTLSKPVESISPQQENLDATIKKLKLVCTANDAQGAKDALMAWGRQQFNTTSLEATAAFCEARLRDEILALSQALYGQQAEKWEGKKLFQVFTEHKARIKIANKDKQVLEPLYRL